MKLPRLRTSYVECATCGSRKVAAVVDPHGAARPLCRRCWPTHPATDVDVIVFGAGIQVPLSVWPETLAARVAAPTLAPTRTGVAA